MSLFDACADAALELRSPSLTVSADDSQSSMSVLYVMPDATVLILRYSSAMGFVTQMPGFKTGPLQLLS